MSPRLSALGLPAVAVALVGGVLAVHLAYGGGQFEPLRPADPCVVRDVTSQSEGIEALTEQLVLIGLDEAACTLGTSREALTLELARSGAGAQADAQADDRADDQADALRDGLLAAVARMQGDGTLPATSDLVDEALDTADLNGVLEAVIRAVPDSVVDAALPMDDVLTRAIEDLDLHALLANLDDQAALEAQVQAAVSQAVVDSLVARVRDLV
ncbi:hypothetical protein KM427_12575 [Nocardioides sp. LMS-CY]|uniref:hypothetical protein n=1 Tax=Nocardioides sp. (strain LMS-CY) TaxID=2840457 RepID=UPI001C007503|nr:hypothetical protein [Nocardioides sp. LMS-CY]QWF24449.1 hypothetical protein KM427_12575 [Nocardioides sp. LMS-CY]